MVNIEIIMLAIKVLKMKLSLMDSKNSPIVMKFVSFIDSEVKQMERIKKKF
jgi:hypothetical protein